MRTLTKLLLMVGLALTMSTSAGATLTISLVQIGGNYDGVSANPGDTLVLDIQYSYDLGDTYTLIDPGILTDAAFSSLDVGASTETGFSSWGGTPFSPIGTPGLDIAMAGAVANGWEKAGIDPVTPPCGYGPGGSCTSLGTASFVLSGVGMAGGTTITDGTFGDIVGVSNLGTFTVAVIPEPTTASLLGLGLLGLTVAGRRRN
jgi:hypothetical protein